MKDYSERKSVDDVRECVKSLYDGDKKIRAYPADVKSIWRTLVILLDKRYEKNIIRFMTEKISEWGTENFCSKVAFRLYLLSYSDIGKPNKDEVKELLNGGKRGEDELKNKIKEAKAILKNSRMFKEEYKKWFGSDQRWHSKRLWAALRDYKKHETLSEIFIKGIEKNKQELWEENFNEEQLELPGDVWNNKPSFRNNIFAELIDIPNIPKSWEMPRIIRQLYGQMKKANKVPSNFYPEQFDVTFDFVPRMCEKWLCDVCPFGKDGAKSICKPGGQYCTVALVTCGYLVKCEEEGCVIKDKDDVGKGICQGRK